MTNKEFVQNLASTILRRVHFGPNYELQREDEEWLASTVEYGPVVPIILAALPEYNKMMAEGLGRELRLQTQDGEFLCPQDEELKDPDGSEGFIIIDELYDDRIEKWFTTILTAAMNEMGGE